MVVREVKSDDEVTQEGLFALELSTANPACRILERWRKRHDYVIPTQAGALGGNFLEEPTQRLAAKVKPFDSL